MKKAIIALGLVAATLAGCKGETTPSGEGAATESAAKSSALPTGWKATDACSIIDKAAMSEVMKTQVTSTALDMVHQPGAAEAATSQCTYKFAEGMDAQVMTRWSPIGDNTAETIAAARSAGEAAIKAFSSKPIEDAPGLGKAAFFVPGINQLHVFIDDARMITISLPSAPNAEGKDRAIALAKKAGA